MERVKYAAVVVNRRVEAIDRVFHYRVPEVLANTVRIGSSVRIPFSRQFFEGLVVELSDNPPAEVPLEKIKDIESLLSQQPLFTEEMLALSRWLSEYYLCPWVAAIQAMLPAGLVLSGKLTAGASEKRYYPISGDDGGKLTAKQAAVMDYLLKSGGAAAKELNRQGFSVDVLNRMEKNGLILSRVEETAPEDGGEDTYTDQAQLSPAQQEILDEIIKEWEGNRQSALIHGVTGSGKTEIYLRFIEHVIAAVGQAILLVPEIALTPQMALSIRRRLGDGVAVLHSGMTEAERRHSWRGISSGRYDVVLGARSAVFAPLPRLKLIIIDEEHESSYKQENVPRFHTREVAKKRTELSGGMLIAGSATPSAETYYGALQGEYKLFTMTDRFYQARLPQVQIIDMRDELRRGNRSIFSVPLSREIALRLAKGEQTLLFLNRRGYYTFYSCRNCGEAVKCPHCEVSLSYHEKERCLKCHYCGYERGLPDKCPACGSPAIKHFGSGTQRVADEVKRLFPAARVLRLDRDVAQKRGSHEYIYQQMLAGEADILVGTQMIAKGLDFPNVTLAGVISADTTLNLPDWRAGERTFQLLTQLIGRAGRREKRGLAIIQTYSPDSAVIKAAAAQDYNLFYEREILQREIALYPPFCSMIRLLFTAEDESALIIAAKTAAGYLGMYLDEDGGELICGPAPAPIERLKDRYRRQIILKGTDLNRLRDAVIRTLRLMKEEKLLPKSVSVQVDVEPFSMM